MMKAELGVYGTCNVSDVTIAEQERDKILVSAGGWRPRSDANTMNIRGQKHARSTT